MHIMSCSFASSPTQLDGPFQARSTHCRMRCLFLKKQILMEARLPRSVFVHRGFTALCGHPTMPIRHASTSVLRHRPPSPRHLRLPRLGQVARRGGRRWLSLGQAQASWPLPGRATILGHRLARSDRSSAPRCVIWKNKGEKRMLQAYISSVLDVL